MPKHRVYVEPFGGAMSVLLRKPRSYAEIYNDLDEQIVAFFKVLRDAESAERLNRAMRLTPFARGEFYQAYGLTNDPVENARRLVIRSFMGFGSDGHNARRPTGFRANSNRSGTTPAHDWVNLPDSQQLITERLAGVTIENRPAMQVSTQHDGPETLHYFDPPYVSSTRAAGRDKGQYVHEMTDENHAQFLVDAKALEGMVMISGYPHDLYEEELDGWHRHERKALADGARERTEVLWCNFEPALSDTLDLFAEVTAA